MTELAIAINKDNQYELGNKYSQLSIRIANIRLGLFLFSYLFLFFFSIYFLFLGLRANVSITSYVTITNYYMT